MSLPILSTATEVTALSSLVTIPGQCHASCSSYFFLFIQPSSPSSSPLRFDLTTSTTTSLFSRPNLATSVFQAHLRYLKHQSYKNTYLPTGSLSQTRTMQYSLALLAGAAMVVAQTVPAS